VFANKSIVGGVAETLGFGANELSGTQVEDFPYYFIKDPSANDFEKNFNIYLTHTYYHTAPAPSTNCLAKHGSPLYTSELTQLGWKEFRLTLGLALMADGFFSHFTEDPWYEEFSVNPVTGVADPLAASQPQNRHWMGQPLGKFRRIYTETAFEPADAVLTQLGKTASLNGDYTLCFTASMPKPKRVVQFGLGDRTRSTLIPTKPKRFVYTFYGQTGTKDIRIDTSEGVTVSDIYLFKGTANLLRRDFEKAVVFANMGKQSVTVAPAPGERWMRIKGNGGNLDPTNDGTVYDGNQSNSFVLPAEDAAILVKLSGSLPPPQAPRGLRVE